MKSSPSKQDVNKRSILESIDMNKLNAKLNMMSQMPNNNIGLTLIFRRLRLMGQDQQKQFVSNFDQILIILF